MNWIKADEKLPQTYDDHGNTNWVLGYIADIEDETSPTGFGIVYYDEDCERWFNDFGIPSHKMDEVVTHWAAITRPEGE